MAKIVSLCQPDGDPFDASKHVPLGELLIVTTHNAPRLFLSPKIKVFLGTPNCFAQGDESKSYEELSGLKIIIKIIS